MPTTTADTAYLALRLPAGTRVMYRGSDASHHGEWTVQPCACPHCCTAILLGQPARRYELRTADGKPGPLVHVRHTSVIPLPDEQEMNEAGDWLAAKYAAVHLHQELRRASPRVKFFVRTGRNRKQHEITVSWSGGPGRTAVDAVTAPVLARYGADGPRRPRPLTVTVGGRMHRGVPIISAVHLDRN
ncbi:LPD29 domain-containing protein [Streptomyces qinglanensis]|uniref:LPD29 domain-containing protein n=1 Tax=Streptomyces qinglanensis TaxID=943816 RepID=UPI003D745D3E